MGAGDCVIDEGMIICDKEKNFCVDKKVFYLSGPKPKDNRLGETNIMKNGMEVVIVRYKSSAEIDVQFPDGIRVENKTYDSFKKGLIGHPNTLHKSKLKDRTGEVRRMSNGMNATIIRYVNGKNIDVEFEDGAIRKGCAYKEFDSGNIAHPSQTAEAQAENRTGEIRRMNCGMIATITRYNSYHDVEVTFEDGEVVYPVDYGQFVAGSIAHPKYDGNMSLQEAAVAFYLTKLGFIKMPRGSLKDFGFGNLELDLYNQKMAVAVEVDGHFHKNSVERDVNKNLKCHAAGITLYRIRDKDLPSLTDGFSFNYVLEGEMLYNGLRDCGDIVKEIIAKSNMQMPSDSFVDVKRDLELIQEYYFTNSMNYNRQDRIGERSFHKASNQFMTIIDYRDYHHIDIRFDDGAIVYNKNYGAFRNGEIKHP